MMPVVLAGAADTELSAASSEAVLDIAEMAATPPINTATKRIEKAIVRTYRRWYFAFALRPLGNAAEGC